VEEVNSRMSRNEKLLRAFLEAVSTTDFHRLEEICSSDFVLELPYNDPPTHLEGFAAYRAAVEPSLEVFRFRLDLGEIHEGRDPDLLFAEYTSDGIAVPTGKPYRNTYIGVFRFREGRLVSLREFFNPAIAAEALAAN
jgi:ketosteroid isomerase-like protein